MLSLQDKPRANVDRLKKSQGKKKDVLKATLTESTTKNGFLGLVVVEEYAI